MSNTNFVVEYCSPWLVFPLTEIVRFCPHSNIKILDVTSGLRDNRSIGLNFEESNEVGVGQYTAICTKVPNPPLGERLVVYIRYRRITEALRALGRILGIGFAMSPQADATQLLTFSEQAQFVTLGTMIDCSRCGVPRIETLLAFIRFIALMGMNTLQLYTEDTYKVEGEPFFGFLRGGFTQEQLATIDQYASQFGVEVFPCIQTLGHMGQVLQWPQYACVKDTPDVLLPGTDATYMLIDKIIETISRPFKSRRIHIGMDEATGLGEGRFKQLFGVKDTSDIMFDHIQKVTHICRVKGLSPMIWSDMVLAQNLESSPTQESHQAPARLLASPDTPSLVYWEYFQTDPHPYVRKIQQHRECGFEPWVAGGIWTWNRFFTALSFTFDASKACLQACKQQRIQNVFATIWGDDGNECDIFSSLPGLLFYSEHGYTSADDIDENQFRNSFAGICGGNLDDFVAAGKIDSAPITADVPYYATNFPPNMSKWILWQDPFYEFLSPQYQDYDLETHYTTLAESLKSASQNVQRYPLNSRLHYPYLLATVLALKSHLRQRLVVAYRTQNRDELIYLTTDPLQKLRDRLELLWRYHRTMWLSTNSPFGSEILELRYGAIRTRLESLQLRLLDFIKGSISDIPEFGEDLSVVYENSGPSLVLDFARIYSPVRALGTG
ncbi:family 20 glycoside hydrolase [Polychytrium aggregatum]|uniref:family 20 glycoside hydrolase n=1 Tax=Polychytrium aggregatum TaxID=110093 RepID=UPI0022FED34B|nr:family 20 glycoside hydrolase [Polychytrium aggregatum]KAI9193734.1 family 20 glycoside hydrolase [Polychytrium aggregatum]